MSGRTVAAASGPGGAAREFAEKSVLRIVLSKVRHLPVILAWKTARVPVDEEQVVDVSVHIQDYYCPCHHSERRNNSSRYDLLD